jgi:hypothetical protein
LYRIETNPEFWAPVRVVRPGEPSEPETFRAKFKALTADEFDAQDLATPDGTRAFLDEVLVDADEIESGDGSLLALTSAVRGKLLSIPHVRIALVRAYMAAFGEAAQGN